MSDIIEAVKELLFPLAWIPSTLAFILVILKFQDYWKNIDRIEFSKLTAELYYTVFSQREADAWGEYHIKYKTGDPQHVFVVLEFTITNNYSHAIGIGKINVGGWMYEDRYTRGLYDHERDYRVYNLYTREQASLSDYPLVESGKSLGFRIEAYEYPGLQHGNRSRRFVDLPSKYTIDVKTDKGSKKFNIEKINSKKYRYFSDFYPIYRLSNTELIPRYTLIGNHTVPQGVTHQYTPFKKTSIKTKFNKIFHTFKFQYHDKKKKLNHRFKKNESGVNK